MHTPDKSVCAPVVLLLTVQHIPEQMGFSAANDYMSVCNQEALAGEMAAR